MIRTAAARPFFRRAGAHHRQTRLDRAAFQRHHDGIDLGQRQVSEEHADGLHRTQTRARQRIGEIGGTGVVVGDAARATFRPRSRFYSGIGLEPAETIGGLAARIVFAADKAAIAEPVEFGERNG